MKNFHLVSALFISSTSFSFHKMEGIYVDEKIIKVMPLSDWINEKKYKDIKKEKPISFFLYDKHTSLQMHAQVNLGFIEEFSREKFKFDLNLASPRTFQFLNCDFHFNSDSFNLKNRQNLAHINEYIEGFFYRKQLLLFQEDGTIVKKNNYSFTTTTKINDCLNILNLYVKDESDQKGDFILNKKLKSLSGVEITHTGNRLMLKKENTEVDMTNALRNYFIKSTDDKNTLQVIIEPFSDARPSLNEVDHDRLQSSTILAIWTLIPQEKKVTDKEGQENITTIESKMIGLARDDKDNTLFHFATNLEKDISVLVD